MEQVDLVGVGWGGLVARALAVGWPTTVRAIATLDTPAECLEGEFLARWHEAQRDPSVLRKRIERGLTDELSPSIRAELMQELRATPDAVLSRVYADLRVRRRQSGPGEPDVVLRRVARPDQPWLDSPSWAGLLEQPEQLWTELEVLASRAPSA